jgi:hypothetical protein
MSSFIAPSQTNTPNQTTAAGIHLREAKLQQALELYAQIKGRTILRHPLLKPITVSLDAEIPTAAAFEDMFRQHGIATIVDGEKFVMVVPIAQTNFVTPRSNKIVSTVLGDLSSMTNNVVIPAGAINFLPTDLDQVIPIYSDIIERKPASGSKFPYGLIYLRTVNPLSKAEVIYALETLFAWNGFKLVPEDDKTFRAESFGRR